MCACIVFITWTIIYGNAHLKIPPTSTHSIPSYFANRSEILAKYLTNLDNNLSIPSSLMNQKNNQDRNNDDTNEVVMHPSKLGSFIYHTSNNNDSTFRLVCYYGVSEDEDNVKVSDISPKLCTHLNVGIFDVRNSTLILTDKLRTALTDVQALKLKNPELKVCLWIGAAFTGHFSEMVHTHATRKDFIRSVKAILEEFRLDGIDLDWEFPNGMTNERIHFAQLLHEIRREYQREHRTYLLSLAVAAPSILVDLTYDVREINDNVDFVNIMTYDFHFYSKQTPWTGFNAPLFRRHNEPEGSVWAMMNINYSVNYWETRGLERSKIVIGLPTYAHTFKLVNPFNTKIGGPAEGYGRVGKNGKFTLD